MKYIIVNTLFFGIIGSWVGGAIFLSILAIGGTIPYTFIDFLFISPFMGIIPGSATGYLFIRDYKKQVSKFNIIPRRFELLLACKNSFLVVVTVLTLLSISQWELPKSIENLVGFGLFFLICLFSAIICAALLSKWNRNIFAKRLSEV